MLISQTNEKKEKVFHYLGLSRKQKKKNFLGENSPKNGKKKERLKKKGLSFFEVHRQAKTKEGKEE